jgi:hypothetical protein
MKMSSNLFFLLLHEMVFNRQLPSPNGSAVVCQFLKAVSAVLYLWQFVHGDYNQANMSLYCLFLVVQLNIYYEPILLRMEKASSFLCLQKRTL